MRKKTWSTDLFALINSRRHTPFERGKHDCTLFAADCVQAMTGVDPAAGYRGYSTEQGAMLIVGKFGSLEKLVDSMFPRVDLRFAGRGDIVMFNSTLDDKPGLGICVGMDIVAATGSGVGNHSMLKAIYAWSVN